MKRSGQQNNFLWSCLTDISQQLKWPVNGVMQTLAPSEWKDVLTAGLRKEQRIAAGIDGGFVLLGQRTSKMTVTQMKELLDFIQWFCADREIKLSAAESDYPEAKAVQMVQRADNQ